MNRLGAATVLALLVATLPSGGAALAADEADGTSRNAATVGIRTANQQSGDDRGKYEFEIFPSGVLRDFVAVANYRDEPIRVRLLARDATSVTGTAYAVQSSAEKPRDVGAWIDLKKQSIRLPAHTEKIVPFEISVPDDARPGDHAGAILVSLLAKQAKPTGGTVVIDHRVGMKVAVRVPGELRPELSVENMSVAWGGVTSFLGRGDATLRYTVLNTGNVVMRATQEVRFARPGGLRGTSGNVPPIDEILPGGTVDVIRVVPGLFGAGPMTATLALRTEPADPALSGGAGDVSEKVSFSAWPGVLIGWIAAVLLIVGGGGWFGRRRLEEE